MVDVIIGGQYGSEGKGKVSNVLSETRMYDGYVRVGGPNSGHTFYRDSEKFICRVLPCCLNHSQEMVNIFLPAGSYIDVDLLKKELAIFDKFGIRVNLHIDPYAAVITSLDCKDDSKRKSTIASTGSGTGSVLSKRIDRDLDNAPVFAKDCKPLYEYLDNVSETINLMLENGYNILLEGTQGFGLSVLHSHEWPYVTARDTTVMGFLSEAGISPYYLNDVYMVIRTYPIRVGGNSGPMKDEISWEEINERKGGIQLLYERTSVTNTVRRVAEMDYDLVKRAIRINKPTRIVMNFLDYIEEYSNLEYYPTDLQVEWIKDFEAEVERKIDYFGFDNLSIYRRCELALDKEK